MHTCVISIGLEITGYNYLKMNATLERKKSKQTDIECFETIFVDLIWPKIGFSWYAFFHSFLLFGCFGWNELFHSNQIKNNDMNELFGCFFSGSFFFFINFHKYNIRNNLTHASKFSIGISELHDRLTKKAQMVSTIRKNV